MDGIIIQARTGSTRLHNKILLPFYKGQCILDIIINNIKRSCSDKVIVLATSTRAQDDVLADKASELGIECFRGDEDNVLGRFIGAAEYFGLDRFIRVCSDNPFLMTDSFNQLFREHDKCNSDYVAFGFSDGRPTIKSHLGLYSELTTLKALSDVASITDEKLYIEHVTIYIYTHRDRFKVRLLSLPDELEGRTDLRFTLDTMEDFKLLQEIYDIYMNDENRSIGSLIKIVESNPSYRDKMLENITHNEK